MVVNNPEVDFSSQKRVHSQYKYRQIFPQSSEQTVNITPTGGQQSVFELPADTLFNLSKSYVEFTVNLPAPGANRRNYIHTDGFVFWSAIKLSPSAGVPFADLYDLNYYLNAASRRSFKNQDMITWDKLTPVDVGADTIVDGTFEGLSACNSDASQNLRPITESGGTTAILEPLYLVRSDIAQSLTMTVRFGFDKIINTIFSCKKNLVFKQSLYLTINWCGLDKFCWTASTVTGGNPDDHPTTDPQSVGVIVVNPPTTPTAITNFKLNLACDQNMTTQEIVRRKVAEGSYEFPVNYITNNISSTTSGTSQNPTIKVTGSMGKTLQKIYYIPYLTNGSLNSTYWHDNTSGATLGVLNSFLDDKPLQTSDMDTTNFDDYMLVREQLRGSCLFSKDEYYFNWCWVQDFTGGTIMRCDEDEENVVDGLVLTGYERRFYIKANAMVSQAYDHRFFTVTQKILKITNSEITFG